MKRLSLALATLALAALAVAEAPAQTVKKPALTLDGAKRVMAAAEAACRAQNFPASIAIVDDGGHLLLLARLMDWTPVSARVAIGKAETAAVFRRSTGAFEEIIKNGRTAMVALDDFTPLQGGVPIVVDGVVVGAIGVSGSNPPKDEEIAKLGADAVLVAAAR
jgi:glc operon protein GlcG